MQLNRDAEIDNPLLAQKTQRMKVRSLAVEVNDFSTKIIKVIYNKAIMEDRAEKVEQKFSTLMFIDTVAPETQMLTDTYKHFPFIKALIVFNYSYININVLFIKVSLV